VITIKAIIKNDKLSNRINFDLWNEIPSVEK